MKKPDNVTDFKRRAIKMKVSNDGWVYTSLHSMFPDECGTQSLFFSNPAQQVPEQKITEASKVTEASKIEDKIIDPTQNKKKK